MGKSIPGRQGCRSGKPTYRMTPKWRRTTVKLPASLLDADRRWTASEVAAEVGVCHNTVLDILQDILVLTTIKYLFNDLYIFVPILLTIKKIKN